MIYIAVVIGGVSAATHAYMHMHMPQPAHAAGTHEHREYEREYVGGEGANAKPKL